MLERAYKDEKEAVEQLGLTRFLFSTVYRFVMKAVRKAAKIRFECIAGIIDCHLHLIFKWSKRKVVEK